MTLTPLESSTVAGSQGALGPVIGQVQTDTFCEGCGYNLLTQSVMRDQRLGILVCRCPECGRFHAAGKTSSAARVWLNRLGSAMLLAWVFFLLLVFGLCSLFLGMAANGHVESMVTYESTPVPVSPSQLPTYARYSYHSKIRVDSPDEPSEEIARRHFAHAMLFVVTFLLGIVTGALFSTFLWHLRGWRRWLAFVPPLLGCGFAASAWLRDNMNVLIQGWGARQFLFYLGFEMVAVAIGVLIGRPVARGMLHILLPPGLKQHMAFLWIRDGKVLKAQ